MRIDSDPAINASTGLTQRKTAATTKIGVPESVSRGVDTVSFSRYVIRSRAEARAEAALAGAQKSTEPAQAPKLDSLKTSSAEPASGSAAPATTTGPTDAAPAEQASAIAKNLVQNLIKRVYGQKDLDAVTAAWGATRGDRTYSAAADPNNDGVVNFDDQNFILANWGQPVQGGGSIPDPDLSGPFAQVHLDAVKDRFGAKTGDERYLEDADANRDGVIDFNDITHVISNWGLPRTPPTSG